MGRAVTPGDRDPRSGPPEPASPVLEVRNLSKQFGGEQALRSVDLTVLGGEVHGVLGENGSGKSTLIKILAGYHTPEPGGEAWVNGQPVDLPLRPGEFRSLGMSFVHQDLALSLTLSVVENLRLGDMTYRRKRLVSWRREAARARETFARYGVEIDPTARVGDLRATDRALLAIVRAMEGLAGRPDASLLVLDEPSVFLPRQGVVRLFNLVQTVRAGGSGVLFVSHNLDEILEITDRVTVLRDGRAVGTRVTAETSETELVEMIIGRQLTRLTESSRRRQLRGIPAVAVSGLAGGLLRDLSFTANRGEILGFAGLAGAGFEDIPYLLFGARPARRGTLSIEGATYDLPSLTPDAAVRARVALVPADRARDGSALSLSVGDNVMLQTMDDYRRNVIRLSRRGMAGAAAGVLAEYDVRPSDPRTPYRALSGGNQQKALLAKWLQRRPDVLLLHEPVQGVDIGARHQIFKLIKQAAADGMTVICASSDYEQLAQTCDRVLIIDRGRAVAELEGEAVTKHGITEQCYQSAGVA